MQVYLYFLLAGVTFFLKPITTALSKCKYLAYVSGFFISFKRYIYYTKRIEVCQYICESFTH